jgi:hypothetical protein
MTSSEMIDKLNQAQRLLSDIYHWASEMQESKLVKNRTIAELMSTADGCIWEAIDELDGNE